MKRINKLTLSALALPIAVVPAITTSCNKQQSEPFEIDSKGLVTLKDKSLKEVTIPATINDIKVQGIASNGFKDTKVETVTFEKPDQITHIFDNAFAGCTSLKSFSVPKNVKYLGIAAFSGCTSLTTCNFDNDSVLETIKERTFEDTAIVDITIPASIFNIEKKVFAYSGTRYIKKVILKTKTGWKHKGTVIDETVTKAPEACANKFVTFGKDDTNNWGYTGIERTARVANINYDAVTSVFDTISEQKTTINEKHEAEGNTIMFKAKAQQDHGGKFIIWVTTSGDLTLTQEEYDVGDSAATATNCYLTINDWTYINNNDTLYVRALKKVS